MSLLLQYCIRCRTEFCWVCFKKCFANWKFGHGRCNTPKEERPSVNQHSIRYQRYNSSYESHKLLLERDKVCIQLQIENAAKPTEGGLMQSDVSVNLNWISLDNRWQSAFLFRPRSNICKKVLKLCSPAVKASWCRAFSHILLSKAIRRPFLKKINVIWKMRFKYYQTNCKRIKRIRLTPNRTYESWTRLSKQFSPQLK